MPSRRSLPTLAALLLVTISASAAFGEPKRLLFIGNSFSSGVPTIVHDIAVADGQDEPVVVQELTGGQDLEYHLSQIDGPDEHDNVGSLELSAGQTWDSVVIQGFSTEATDRLGDYNTFASDALKLYSAITEHASGKGVGAKAMLYQTWGYQADHTFYAQDPPLFESPTAMQAQIRTGYETAEALINQQLGAGSADIAPVGDAFEAMGFDTSLYASDHLHPNSHGSVLAGMVIYRSLYPGERVSDIDYDQFAATFTWRVDEVEFKELAAIADAVSLPEPGSLGLLFCGTLAVFARRR